MRTLLRDTVTGLFLQSSDKWTSDPERAFDFRFTDRALKYVETWHLDQVEIAFAFSGQGQVTGVALGRAALQFAASDQ